MLLVAKRELLRTRVTMLLEKQDEVSVQDARELFRELRGLDTMDRRYLRCIAEVYGGGPVGVETLAAALSEQLKTFVQLKPHKRE